MPRKKNQSEASGTKFSDSDLHVSSAIDLDMDAIESEIKEALPETEAPGEPEKAKRKHRRTKAEIEAESKVTIAPEDLKPLIEASYNVILSRVNKPLLNATETELLAVAWAKVAERYASAFERYGPWASLAVAHAVVLYPRFQPAPKPSSQVSLPFPATAKPAVSVNE